MSDVMERARRTAICHGIIAIENAEENGRQLDGKETGEIFESALKFRGYQVVSAEKIAALESEIAKRIADAGKYGERVGALEAENARLRRIEAAAKPIAERFKLTALEACRRNGRHQNDWEFFAGPSEAALCAALAEPEGRMAEHPSIEKLADGILDGLLDRRGFRQTWDEIDDDIKAEIKSAIGRAAYRLVAEDLREECEPGSVVRYFLDMRLKEVFGD